MALGKNRVTDIFSSGTLPTLTVTTQTPTADVTNDLGAAVITGIVNDPTIVVQNRMGVQKNSWINY
jgi:hypothetical protein